MDKRTSLSLFGFANAQINSQFKNFTASTTVEFNGVDDPGFTLSDTNITSLGNISGSVLKVDCLLLVRQLGDWQDPKTNNTGSVTFGSFSANGDTVANNFQSFGVPNGVFINEPLDISILPTINHHLWFTVDYSSLCVASYGCTGSLFKKSYNYNGLICNNPSASSTATIPSSTASQSPPSSTAIAPQFSQCGGIGWNGPTICAAGSKCVPINDFFSECL
ncbi:hypothetical protein ONZ45_g7898 [Pleurotus djamor]|nr:hypothetical protein ONZ45_g7898 [Pleurotus djamor]